MSWSTAADIATTLGTFVALVAVVVTSRLTVRGQSLERQQAEATASRTEQAAALTEEYTQRVVDALETMATTPMVSAGTTPVIAPRVRWSLVHHAGDTYRLENEGDLTADEVQIETDPTLRIHVPPETPTIGPGEAVTFMASVHMGTKDRTVTVTWVDGGSSERKTWRYPLPSRPPRK